MLDLLDVCNFLKEEAPAQVLYCEFQEFFKNTSFIEHLPLTTASALSNPDFILSVRIPVIEQQIF